MIENGAITVNMQLPVVFSQTLIGAPFTVTCPILPDLSGKGATKEESANDLGKQIYMRIAEKTFNMKPEEQKIEEKRIIEATGVDLHSISGPSAERPDDGKIVSFSSMGRSTIGNKKI